jgi:hypothetical protein
MSAAASTRHLGSRITDVFVMLLILVALLQQGAAQVTESGAQDPPTFNGPSRLICPFAGLFLHVASKSAGPEGLLVRVSPPAKARYSEGAPIAVHVNAATRVDGSRACLSEQGFIDVSFLCPGGQYQATDGTIRKSGAQAGPRTPPQECVEPLADVLSFATGQIRSVEGKSIQDYAGSVKALTDNAGVIGWAGGGNLAVLAMARHGERFLRLRWYGSFESPFLGTVDVGFSTIFQANPFYDPATGRVDFERLRYSPEMPLWVWPIQILQRLPRSANWPHGGLYLDGDGNGRFNKDADYAFWVDLDPGPPVKAFYSPVVTREARERKVFGDQWPTHIATMDEVEQRASREDALRHIPRAVQRFPRLAIVLYESQRQNVSTSVDHPDAIAQMNAWLDAGAGWVRFNPDARYVESIMGRKPSREVQYPAGRKINRGVIRDLVEPADKNGGPTDREGMTAVVCELADRTYFKNWARVLTRVLVQYKPAGALAP